MIPIIYIRLEAIPHAPITEAVNGSTSAFQHRFSDLYDSSAYTRMRVLDTFPRSDNPICAYALRFLL